MTENNQRRFERMTFERQLVLDCGPERIFAGVSADVSLSGVFLKTRKPPVDLFRGETGVLRLKSKEETLDFPCKVIRVTLQGVALQLNGKEALFGMAMTKDIFENMIER